MAPAGVGQVACGWPADCWRAGSDRARDSGGRDGLGTRAEHRLTLLAPRGAIGLLAVFRGAIPPFRRRVGHMAGIVACIGPPGGRRIGRKFRQFPPTGEVDVVEFAVGVPSTSDLRGCV